MKKFRIVATPPGEAPLEVRQGWVGLELPLSEPETGVQIGVLGGRPENVGGYAVEGKIALKLLEMKNPEAAEWWYRNAPYIFIARLVFAKSVCELIETE